MKLRCKVCEHTQDGEHLMVKCGGCGARQSMTFAPSAAALKPGEPVVGPSRVPITRSPEGQLRGPYDEPLEVTRERTRRRAEYARGICLDEARQLALEDVPVQCGCCGGDDPSCVVCRGVATVPTAALAAERAARQSRPSRGSTTSRRRG